MRTRSKALGVAAATAGIVLLSGTPAFAYHCYNPDKQPGAGAQIIFGPDDSVEWVSAGLQKRIDRGLVDMETGEGFTGLVGIDFDGDGAADATTWMVGPDAEIPEQAQAGGDPCHGVTNFETFFEQCV